MRRSGIVLHPVSLPGPWGIGSLGEHAFRFVEWLRGTGQSLWQVLPLGPVGADYSPYMSDSAFAGNPLLIDLQDLVRRGWLRDEDVIDQSVSGTRVEYEHARTLKQRLLRQAFAAFVRAGGPRSAAFQDFCRRHGYWLEHHALFTALKAHYDGEPWYRWPADIKRAEKDAVARARAELSEAVERERFVQFVFFSQWHALRRHCTEHGVDLVGDLPLYVALDSSDVWAHRGLFQLDEQGQPLAVAGVPPDYFSASGQRWGNPLYRWEAMAEDDYRWWQERFRVNFEWVTYLRLDHFRGYVAYWEVPAADLHTTRNGRWVAGPGAPFFARIERALQQAHIPYALIAEDLGVITADVDALRDALGYPGMRILQMAFGDDPKASEYLPHNHIRNCVVYTATHDHNTSRGWFTAAPGSQTAQTPAEVAEERYHALTYLGTDGREIHWDMIRMALGSVAELALMPLQDVLGLDSDARMNLPGTTENNWAWRFQWSQLDGSVSERLRVLTEVYERSSRKQPAHTEPH